MQINLRTYEDCIIYCEKHGFESQKSDDAAIQHLLSVAKHKIAAGEVLSETEKRYANAVGYLEGEK